MPGLWHLKCFRSWRVTLAGAIGVGASLQTITYRFFHTSRFLKSLAGFPSDRHDCLGHWHQDQGGTDDHP
jgi:hypothetical protein